MPDLQLRPYSLLDRNACREIIRSQIGSYLADGEDKDYEWFLDKVEEGIADIYFCIAVNGDETIGCGGVWIEDEIATLCWGILKAGHLSKGVGKSLLQHRLAWVRENRSQVKSILCDTAPKTEGFFAKFGFVPYFRKPAYWGGSLELVAMELTFDGNARGPERTRKRLEAQQNLSETDQVKS